VKCEGRFEDRDGRVHWPCRGSAPTIAQQRVLVLEGGTVIDGTGKPPIPDAVVVVEGDRIKAIGPRGRVQYPPAANVIRANGRTILPGLIDGHVHLRDYHRRSSVHRAGP